MYNNETGLEKKLELFMDWVSSIQKQAVNVEPLVFYDKKQSEGRNFDGSLKRR